MNCNAREDHCVRAWESGDSHGNVGIGSLRRGALGDHAGGRVGVQEVPDEYCVVVRAAHDLELVELQPEHAPGVLLYSTQ